MLNNLVHSNMAEVSIKIYISKYYLLMRNFKWKFDLKALISLFSNVYVEQTSFMTYFNILGIYVYWVLYIIHGLCKPEKLLNRERFYQNTLFHFFFFWHAWKLKQVFQCAWIWYLNKYGVRNLFLLLPRLLFVYNARNCITALILWFAKFQRNSLEKYISNHILLYFTFLILGWRATTNTDYSFGIDWQSRVLPTTARSKHLYNQCTGTSSRMARWIPCTGKACQNAGTKGIHSKYF